MHQNRQQETCLGRLTTRETEIVSLLMEGERVSTIAQKLELSRSTVRAHLASSFSKLDVHSQSELIALMRREVRDSSKHASSNDLPELRGSIASANRDFMQAIRDAQSETDPLPKLKKAMRDYLPLSEKARWEWGARLRYCEAVAEGRAEVDEARDKLLKRCKQLVVRSQRLGMMNQDRNPAQVTDEFSMWFFAAAARLLTDDSPATRRRLLAQCDRLLEDLIRPARRTAGRRARSAGPSEHP